MADVQVYDNITGNERFQNNRVGPIWISTQVGYVFLTHYIPSPAYGELFYRKTTDGGETWGSPVTISSTPGDTIDGGPDCWYDKWTPGDSGTLIHLVWGEAVSFSCFYRTLDTANDTLGTTRTVVDFASGLGGGMLSVVKARGGNLYATGYVADNNIGFRRSTNGGVSWTSRTAPSFASNNTKARFQLHPGNEADTQDVWMIMHNNLTSELVLDVYDDSANSWTENTVATSIAFTQNGQMNSATRKSDGHVIVISGDLAWDSATNQVRVWDVGGAANITEKSALGTLRYVPGCGVSIDEPTGNIYVAYGRGATGISDQTIYYKVSTDGGVSWGGETTLSASTYNTVGLIHTSLNVDTYGGRFYPMWFVLVVNDYYSNFDNSLILGAAAAAYNVGQLQALLMLG